MFLTMLLSLDEDEQDFVYGLYETYANAMYRMALDILKNREDAEDAVQSAFCKIMEHLVKFRDASDRDVQNQVMIYMRAIIRNQAIDQYRDNKLRLTNEQKLLFGFDMVDDEDGETEADIPDRDTNVEEIVISNETVRIVEKALLALPVNLQDVINLFHMGGYTYSEIAEIEGIPVDLVKSRLYRARKKLKEMMGELK